MIEAGFVLVTSELTVFTERDDVKPVAVSIDMVLSEIFVPFDLIGFTELLGFVPGLGFDADEFNVASVGVFVEKIMADFVQKLQRGAIRIIDGRRGSKFKTLARFEGERRIVLAKLI